jgi:hypothetical protein
MCVGECVGGCVGVCVCERERMGGRYEGSLRNRSESNEDHASSTSRCAVQTGAIITEHNDGIERSRPNLRLSYLAKAGDWMR